MRTGGATLAMMCGLLVAAPTGAFASALKPGISPQAVAWLGAPPSCPSAEVVDGRAAAQAARDLVSGKTKVSSSMSDLIGDADAADFTRSFYGTLAVAMLTYSPAAVVTVCDPAVATTGQPLATITGDARDAPELEQLGAGLRSRGGEFGRATAAAAIGDRFVLPATGAGSVIDVAVDTTNGAAATRIGPVTAAPTVVRVVGQLEAPGLVVEYADGTSTTHPVTLPGPAKTTVSATSRKGRLELAVKAAPGAFVTTSASNPDSTDSMDALSDPGDLQIVPPSGAVKVRLGALGPSYRRVDLSVVDPERRALDSWACTLRWSKQRLRSVDCAGGPDTSTRPRVGAPLADPARRTANGAVIGEVRRSTSLAASAARAPSLAKIAASAMYRGRLDDDLIDADAITELEPFFADVTGDGRPESYLVDAYGERSELLVSVPSGRWTPVRLRGERYLGPRLAEVGDLNGDGVEELWSTSLDGDARAVAGSPAWSTAPPKALDVRTTFANPRDLLSTDDSPPVPVKDVTGDGRPELVVPVSASLRQSGVATFRSEDAPLGQRLSLPAALSTDPAGLWAAIADEALEPATYDAGGGGVLPTPSGLVTVAPVPDAAGKQRLTLVRLSGDGRALSPLAAFSTAGRPSLQGVDPTTGELLVSTDGEACKQRSCVSRILRVDGATGKVLGGIALRGAGSVSARFVDDGPDADQRAEVVFRDPDGDDGEARKSTIPGYGRQVGRWDSATGSPAWKKLPVLAIGSAAIQAHGPFMGWTSAAGKHHVGTWSLRGKGRKRSLVLLDLTTPR